MGELLHALGRVIALLEQWQHSLAELGEVRKLVLAAEEISPEFFLKQLDRSGQRWLRNVTFLGGPC
ncbi:hypothetical protein WDZ92_49375, partial [Nostoc sp. NIES-2111]